MKEIDFHQALVLMSVIEKVVNVSPASQAILGEAQAELKLIEDAARDNASERANARAEEESRREAARMQELRAAGEGPAELPNETGQDLDTGDDPDEPAPEAPQRRA